MTPLEAALNYASRGWRVVPILPNSKRPALTRWTEQATTDITTIREWYDGHDDYGVGLATGPESGFWVLDVDDIDAFHDLEHRHGTLPSTRTSITGSGGYHFLFRWPDGRDIRNDAGKRLGPGLDIRGDGGQIVVPPTVHPNGSSYEWDLGEPREIHDAPDWLIELLTFVPDEPGEVERTHNANSDRPGDRWAAATTWQELLERDGWTFHHLDRSGEQHWTRPGKDKREGTSATVGYKGSDVLKVFTSSMRAAGLNEEETYTKLGYLAATRFDGDHAAAASFLAGQGWSEQIDPESLIDRSEQVTALAEQTLEAMPEPTDKDDADDESGHWEFVDIGAILDGHWDPPTPTIMRRSDGVGLLYPGRVHSIQGEPGGGKTWLALACAAEVMADGGLVLFIDYEDTPAAVVARLRQLGVADDVIRERFTYVRPDGPLIDKSGRIAAKTMSRLAAVNPTMTIIDSVGESIAAEGFNPSDDAEVARWFRLLPRFMARTGSSVLGLDHVTKDGEKRGLWAIGSQRKLAAIDGAAYTVQVIKAPTKGKDGHLKVLCAKDRHGTHQKGHQVADVHVLEDGDRIIVQIRNLPDEFRPTVLMERVSRYLEDNPGATQRTICSSVKGNQNHIVSAIGVLVNEGFLRIDATARGHEHHMVATYRDDEDLQDLTATTATKARPDGSDSGLELTAITVTTPYVVGVERDSGPGVEDTADPRDRYLDQGGLEDEDIF